MSVNMIAARRQVSACTMLLVSSFIDTDYSAGVVSLSTVGHYISSRSQAGPENEGMTCNLMPPSTIPHPPPFVRMAHAMTGLPAVITRIAPNKL